MDTNKSKVSVSVYMLSNSRAEFVLVSSIVIMHRSIFNKNIERSKIYVKQPRAYFLTFQCIINIKIKESMIWQVNFGGSIKISFVADFRDILT